MIPLPNATRPTTGSGAFRVVVFEGTGSRPLEPTTRRELVTALLQKGHAVTVVRSGSAASAITGGTLVVLGRFTDAQPERAEGNGGAVAIHFRDIESAPAARAAEMVDEIRNELQLPKPGGWKPWFPVIDYDRCTNCMQCLSFCLFDVYGVSADKKIQVQNQNKCKTDCPACSRVCPEVAILFPKYRHGPINGDVVSSDDVRREVMKVDISALLGGDIYQALRDRSAKSKSRFAKERDEDRALEERQKCLVKLGEKLDIPAEVFASLPSIDEIRAKADAAAARAAAALSGN
ncbi:ferredoxin family protein [Fimbriiglobus ruber]|uniref:Putative Fe-S containing oxidoreductase(EC:1.-) n=1 Tax=Fimbriiglobus ruber TaxID=1908690 RepID=A0A225DE21_9BACT|nr:ferredoxin family protein [Fimbriiglobus ruber]OWK36768.1 putative Fe-S containing oxidoreductase(EC:1.-) [Fimbriiglobus ruber]